VVGILSRKGKLKVDVLMSRTFVQLVDEVAGLTGSTRSDLIRRALERYIHELKQANLLRDLREARRLTA
jgi:metal-responsive CopG/Arc/MetJ family transcriptional regulator